MRASIDRELWKKLVVLPDHIDSVVWTRPAGKVWTDDDAETLIAAKPSGAQVGVWKCLPSHPQGNAAQTSRRTFFGEWALRKAARRIHAQDIQFGRTIAWFDFARVDAGCEADLAKIIQRELGYFAGIVIWNDLSDPVEVAQTAANVIEKVWTRQIAEKNDGHHPLWTDEERAELLARLPGHLLCGVDIDTAKYLVATSQLSKAWLLGAAETQLDLDRLELYINNIREPAVPWT